LVLEEICGRKEYDFVLNLVTKPIDCIVDLGANIGLSMRLWRTHFPAAKIIAVEPDEQNARVFECNASLAAAGNHVVLLNAAVLGYRRPVALKRTGGEWAFQINEAPVDEGGVSDIEVITMPELVAHYCEHRKIDLLKCDIEGGEAELFSDCGNWLPGVQLAVVELHGSYLTGDLKRDVTLCGVNIDIVWECRQKNRATVAFRVMTDDVIAR
jgi:FkbM family methyltransferase